MARACAGRSAPGPGPVRQLDQQPGPGQAAANSASVRAARAAWVTSRARTAWAAPGVMAWPDSRGPDHLGRELGPGEVGGQPAPAVVDLPGRAARAGLPGRAAVRSPGSPTEYPVTSPVDGEVRHFTRTPYSARRSANSASLLAPAAAAWTIRRRVTRGASARSFRRAFSASARVGRFAAVRSGFGAGRSRYFFRSAGSSVHRAASAHRLTSPVMIRSRDSLARPPSCRASVATMCTWLSPWQAATHRTPRCSRPRLDSPCGA